MRRESKEEVERLSVNNLLYSSGYKKEKDDLSTSRMSMELKEISPSEKHLVSWQNYQSLWGLIKGLKKLEKCLFLKNIKTRILERGQVF